MTANTPHMVFDELAAASSVPLLSIVEVCAAEAQRRGLRRLLLLGTRFTMEAEFYPTVFARYGIDVVAPDEAERTWVHARYVDELLKGDFRDATRAEFVALIARLRDRDPRRRNHPRRHGAAAAAAGAESSPIYPCSTPRSFTWRRS